MALNQPWDRKKLQSQQWFASTKELQLVSVLFCAACRVIPTLHLRVDCTTPDRLLASSEEVAAAGAAATLASVEEGAPAAAAVAAAAPAAGGRAAAIPPLRRVPRLRARSVTWELPTAEKLSKPLYALATAEVLKFETCFNGSLQGVSWPPRVRDLSFGRRFNQPINGVVFPDSLETLVFGQCFNKAVAEVSWPASLREISFGYYFNRSVAPPGQSLFFACTCLSPRPLCDEHASCLKRKALGLSAGLLATLASVSDLGGRRFLFFSSSFFCVS